MLQTPPPMLAKWSLEVRIPAKELKNGANGQIKASWFFKTWNSISNNPSFHEMFGGLVKQPPLLCKGLESSNWNNHETKWMCEVPGCYPTKSWNFKRLVLDSFPLPFIWAKTYRLASENRPGRFKPSIFRCELADLVSGISGISCQTTSD